MKVEIKDKLHKRIKKLCKGQGMAISDVVNVSIEIYLSKLENHVSMQPDKTKCN